MYICIYVYMYICTFVYMYMYMYSVFVCTCTHTFENDEFVHFSLKYAGMWWAFTPHILPDLIFV